VWDPHYKLHIAALERVQKFALKIAYKSWDDSYETLLLISGQNAGHIWGCATCSRL